MEEDDAGSHLQGVHTSEGINSPTTKILHEAAKDRFPATAYTDLVVQGKYEKFHCHKFIVLRQLPNLEDTLQDIITSAHFDYGGVDVIILAMLKFIYTGSYDGPSDVPEWELLYFHSRVYWLASSYNFQELKKYSEAKFALCVYDAPFETSRGVRDVMLGFCARHSKKLGSNESFYRDLKIPGNFWKEFALHLAGCPDLSDLAER